MRTRNKVIALTTETQINGSKTVSVSEYSTLNVPSSWSGSIGPYNYGSNSTYPIEEKSSWMQDEITDYKRPKGCLHVKERFSVSAPVGSIAARESVCAHLGNKAGYSINSSSTHNYMQRAGASGILWGSSLRYNFLLKSKPGLVVSKQTASDAAIIQSLYDTARKPVVDGLVNLAESPEIPGAINTLTSSVNALRKYSTYQKYQFYLNQNWAALKKLANNHLAYSFGIAPLVSDAQKVHSYLKRLDADYRRYRERAVKRVSRVYPIGLAYTPPTLPDLYYGKVTAQGYSTESCQQRYVLTYRERNPYSTEFFGKLQFLLNRFGSAGPASYIWERTKLSFVIDWFIDTTSIINYLDDVLSTERIETISLTKSEKWSHTTDIFRDVYRADTNQNVQSNKLGTYTCSVYQRYPLRRTTYVAPSERFGKKQALLSASLLRQMFK